MIHISFTFDYYDVYVLFFHCLLKESPSPRANGDHAVDSRDSIGLNGNDKPGGSSSKPSAERPPSRSGSSSSRSTPSLKTKDVCILKWLNKLTNSP